MVAEAITNDICSNASHSLFHQQDRRAVTLPSLAVGVLVSMLIVARVSSLLIFREKMVVVCFLFGCPPVLSGPRMVKLNVLTCLNPMNFVEESTDLAEFSKDGDSSASSGSQSVTALVMQEFLPYAFFRESG